MILVINIAAQSPRNALVHSEDTPVPIVGPSLVVGDTLDVTILIADGAGGYSAIGGEAGATLRVAVGPVPGDYVAFQDTWTAIANGWQGRLTLNTAEAFTLLGTAEFVPVDLEIELTRADGTKTTIAQIPCEMRVELIPEAPISIIGNPSYPTTAELSAQFVHNKSAVTALTGGGSALDGIATPTLALGTMAAVVIGSIVSFYQLISSTAAENPPWVIRPDDYDAGAAKVWVLRQQDVVGFTHVQSTPAASWTGTHNLGYRPAAVALYIGGQLWFAEISVTSTTFTINFGGNYSGEFRLR